MKAQGRKQKGNRLELKVAKALRISGLDPRASRMPLSGASWSLPSDIHTSLPISIECKNTEKIRFWEFWDQCRNQKIGNRTPVLAISANHRPIIMCMDIDDWINLMKIAYEEK
jgi:hypothetical protein